MVSRQLYESIAREAELLKDYPNEYNALDPENRDKLVRKNMRIAVDIALKVAHKYCVYGDDFDELVSQGLLGLSMAWDKYDPNRCENGKPAKFSSVAWMWSQAMVLQELKRILERRSCFASIEEADSCDDESLNFFDSIQAGVGDTDIMIFEMRYGLCGEKPMPLKDICKKTGFNMSAVKHAIESARQAMKLNARNKRLVSSKLLLD